MHYLDEGWRICVGRLVNARVIAALGLRVNARVIAALGLRKAQSKKFVGAFQHA